MSEAQIMQVDQFYDVLITEFNPSHERWDPSDHPMFKRLIELETDSPEEYCNELVNLSRQRGWTLSHNDVSVWLQYNEMRRLELTDDELEVVVGGAGATSGATTLPICTGATMCRTCCGTKVSTCKTCRCPLKCT